VQLFLAVADLGDDLSFSALVVKDVVVVVWVGFSAVFKPFLLECPVYIPNLLRQRDFLI